MIKKRIDIRVLSNDILIGNCDYIKLEKEQYTTGFYFYLNQFNFIKQVTFDQGDVLTIQIYYYNRFNIKMHLFNFEIYLIDDIHENNSIRIFGLMIPIDGIIYDQRIIDIFYRWHNNEEIDWWTLDVDYKESFLYCCGSYSGLFKEIARKTYAINCLSVNEKLDFYYLLGYTFFGNKGYFGDSLYTLGDCLTEIYNNSNSLKNLNLKFVNHQKLILIFGEEYFNEICSLFESADVKILKN